MSEMALHIVGTYTAMSIAMSVMLMAIGNWEVVGQLKGLPRKAQVVLVLCLMGLIWPYIAFSIIREGFRK